MKKQPLLVFISLFLCASLLAQVSVQPLVGGTSSSFDYNNDFEMNQAVQSFDGENKGGFTGGIKVNIPTNDLGWHIAPELFFIQNGSKEFYNDIQNVVNDLISRKVSLDYVGIYLPMKYNLLGQVISDDRDASGILIGVSLYAEYVVGGIIDDDNGKSLSKINFVNGSDKLDFGGSAALEFIFPVPTNTGYIPFSVGIGYDYGVNNINFFSELPNNADERYIVNNQGLNIKAGTLFVF